MRKTTLVVILPVSINILAAPAGSTGKTENLGMIGVVLMDKRASEGTTYAMIDKKKYAKEFDKTVALGNSYQAVMTGDLTCGSTEAENERLVFAQSSGNEKREYKIISLAKTGNADPASLNEAQRLLGDGYQIKDLFYSGGLNVVFEK